MRFFLDSSQNFPTERNIFEREHQSGCYRVISYYLAKSIAEVRQERHSLFCILKCVLNGRW